MFREGSQPGTHARGRAIAEPSASYAVQRREGQFAGVLFIAGSLASLPSSLLITPAPPATIYLLTLLGVISGLLCLVIPWELLSRRWLHAVGFLATVEVTVAAAISDSSYIFYYVFVAVYAAYISRTRAEATAQIGFIVLGLLAPLVYAPDEARQAVQMALLAAPSLGISAGMVLYLRERLEADRREYRRFAEEALELAARIRGRPEEAVMLEPEPSPGSAALRSPFARRPGARTRLALVGAAALLGLPFMGVGLAAAGVTLPEAARAPFEVLGIELPNQPADGDTVAPPSGHGGAAGGADSQPEGGASGTGGDDAAGARTRSGEDDPSGTQAAPAEAPAGAPATSSGSSVSPAPVAPGGQAGVAPPSQDVHGSIERTLNETLGGVNNLLGGLGLGAKG